MAKTKKRSTKRKPESETARFPEAGVKYEPEPSAIRIPRKPEEPFDPRFPNKLPPHKQWIIDTQTIHRTKDLPTFLDALDDILPFWMTNYLSYEITIITHNIHQRAGYLRRQYNRQHKTNARPCPTNLFEMPDWVADAKTELEKPHLCKLSVIVATFDVGRHTLQRLAKNKSLTDHRPPNHPKTTELILDAKEVAQRFPLRKKP